MSGVWRHAICKARQIDFQLPTGEYPMVQDMQLPSDQTSAAETSLVAVVAVLGAALCLCAMMLAVIIGMVANVACAAVCRVMS